jgi:hypothetical protein
MMAIDGSSDLRRLDGSGSSQCGERCDLDGSLIDFEKAS